MIRTAICMASGPSLCLDDVEYCKGKGRVYVVNDCYKMAPWANILYACDLPWWDHHEGVPGFAGERWTLDLEASRKYGLKHIGTLHNEVWSTRPDAIATGRNSGFQALNLAAHSADRIILLGYDMKLGDNKQRHWFGEHTGALNKNSDYHLFIKAFRDAAPLIKQEVINCSRSTALDCFPRASLRDVL